MNKTLKIIIGIILGLIMIYLVWRFSNIVFYIITAAILSAIARPLVKLFSLIRIGKYYVPNLASTLLAMLIMILVVLSFVSLFVPLIARQANAIANIDFGSLNHSLQKPLMNFEFFLKQYNFLGANETLNQIVKTQLDSLVNFATFSDTLSSLVGVTGSIFIAVFSIGFLTFFFTKDAHLLFNVAETLTPIKYQQEVQHVFFQTKHLLSRYFVGLGIEVSTMITLLSIGLTIGGVHNALLIGFFGGLMNIIPYIGPIIGAVVGVILAISSVLSYGEYNEILTIIFIVVGVFAGANLIDNIVLQPLIYSNSVKAHPVEIYLVILIAGSMAGIVGMVLAIPTYTVLRVIAKEFFSQFRVVQRLTQNI